MLSNTTSQSSPRMRYGYGVLLESRFFMITAELLKLRCSTCQQCKTYAATSPAHAHYSSSKPNIVPPEWQAPVLTSQKSCHHRPQIYLRMILWLHHQSVRSSWSAGLPVFNMPKQGTKRHATHHRYHARHALFSSDVSLLHSEDLSTSISHIRLNKAAHTEVSMGHGVEVSIAESPTQDVWQTQSGFHFRDESS